MFLCLRKVVPLQAMTNEELRKRFNPEGSLLRRQQMRMLEILVEIDKICKKHDIRYWLSSGTLIGAMRHNGFIPWDDDLDIEMMRSDYVRLMEVLPSELPDWLALQNDETDPNYFFSTDDTKAIRKVRRIFDFNNRFVFPCLRALLSIFNFQFSIFRSALPLGSSKNSQLSTITSGMGIPFHNRRYLDEIFPLVTHEFEGHEFPVPHDADAHLRHLYGDYMQLPDLNKLAIHVGKLEFFE